MGNPFSTAVSNHPSSAYPDDHCFIEMEMCYMDRGPDFLFLHFMHKVSRRSLFRVLVNRSTYKADDFWISMMKYLGDLPRLAALHINNAERAPAELKTLFLEKGSTWRHQLPSASVTFKVRAAPVFKINYVDAVDPIVSHYEFDECFTLLKLKWTDTVINIA